MNEVDNHGFGYIPEGHHVVTDADGERFVKNDTPTEPRGLREALFILAERADYFAAKQKDGTFHAESDIDLSVYASYLRKAIAALATPPAAQPNDARARLAAQSQSMAEANTILRKIAAHVPGRIWMEAKEKAGYGTEIRAQITDPKVDEAWLQFVASGPSEPAAPVADLRVPENWHQYHSKDCGVQYRGCAPDCPKDQHEKRLQIAELIKASQALGSWMSAAIDDTLACKEFKQAASDFIDALHPFVEENKK